MHRAPTSVSQCFPNFEILTFLISSVPLSLKSQISSELFLTESKQKTKEKINKSGARMNTTGEVEPALIFYPSRPTSREWANMVGAVPGAVSLHGIAASAKIGPKIGIYDIYVNETAYMFCMSLPGVDINSTTFGIEVKPMGEITVQGETTPGRAVASGRYQILNTVAKSLPDPGLFSVTFQLPGPVQVETLTIYSYNDGILWGVLKKQRGESAAASS